MSSRAALRERFRDAALIYNPQAGRARARRERDIGRAAALLETFGIRCTPVPTTGPATATELARREVARGRDLVIACGGDGTVNEIVNGLAGSHIPMALLPAGTGNVLAKELGLPWSIPRAAEYIPRGRILRIALGRAGARHFICMAGVGADAAIVHHLSGRSKSALGILSFWLEGFRQLFTYPFAPFGMEFDGEKVEAVQLIAGRTRHYGGPVRVTPGAGLRTPDFELCYTTARSRWMYLVYFAAQLVGALARMPGVHFRRAASLELRPLEAETFVQVDGEDLGRLPVSIRMVPDALSLLVPAQMKEE